MSKKFLASVVGRPGSSLRRSLSTRTVPLKDLTCISTAFMHVGIQSTTHAHTHARTHARTHTHAHTHTHTHTYTDRQTDKRTNRQTDRQTDKQTNRRTDKQTNRQTGKQTNRQTDKDRQPDRQAGRQTDKRHTCATFPRCVPEIFSAGGWGQGRSPDIVHTQAGSTCRS